CLPGMPEGTGDFTNVITPSDQRPAEIIILIQSRHPVPLYPVDEVTDVLHSVLHRLAINGCPAFLTGANSVRRQGHREVRVRVRHGLLIQLLHQSAVIYPGEERVSFWDREACVIHKGPERVREHVSARKDALDPRSRDRDLMNAINI